MRIMQAILALVDSAKLFTRGQVFVGVGAVLLFAGIACYSLPLACILAGFVLLHFITKG